MIERNFSRRRFMKLSAGGVGLVTFAGLLQACGSDDDDDDDSDGAASEDDPTATPEPEDSSDTEDPTESDDDEAEDDDASDDDASGDETEEEEEPDDGDEGGQSDATVVVATIDAFQSVDPHFTKRAAAKSFAMLIMERLVEPTGPDDPELIPKLATSWEVSDDGTIWTFELQQGVTFHDGTPFNAEAVKFSIDRMSDPDVGATEVTRLLIVEDAEATEEHTVTITTRSTYPEFLLNLSDPAVLMFSPTWAADRSPSDYGREPVGTGPFEFQEWLGPEEAAAVPYSDYWGDQPNVGRIILRQIPDAGALVAAMEAGEVDVTMDVPPTEVDRLREVPELTISEFEGSSTNTLGCLTTKEPFSDVRVRQALNFAVDKQTICDTIFNGLASPTTTPLYPGNMYRIEPECYCYDPDRARELLAEAGYEDGFQTKILLPSTSPTMEACQAIAEYYADVGIEVDLNIVEDAVWSQLVRAGDDERDMFYQGKSGIGVDFNLNRLYSDEAIDEDNRGRWIDDRVLDLLDEGRNTFDEDERAEIYGDIQQIIWDEAVEIFLWSVINVVVTSSSVSGVPVVQDRLILNEVTKQ